MIELARAAEALHAQFGELMNEDYVPGKTRFRDALVAKFGISQLDAEELCDSLERAAVLRFVESAEVGAVWILDPSEGGVSAR